MVIAMKLAQLGQSIKRCAVCKDHPPASICNRGKAAAHRTAATKERHPRSYNREEQHPMGKRQLPMTAQAFPHTHPHPEAPAWDSTTCTLSTGRLNQPIPVSRRRQAKSTWGILPPVASSALTASQEGVLCAPRTGRETEASATKSLVNEADRPNVTRVQTQMSKRRLLVCMPRFSNKGHRCFLGGRGSHVGSGRPLLLDPLRCHTHDAQGTEMAQEAAAVDFLSKLFNRPEPVGPTRGRSR